MTAIIGYTKNRGLTLLEVIIAVSAVIILGRGYLVYRTIAPAPAPIQTVCTQDTKLCPDGSYVGRTGPNCEFALCPGMSDKQQVTSDTANWKTYRNEKYGFSVQYPVFKQEHPFLGYSESPIPRKEAGNVIDFPTPFSIGVEENVSHDSLAVWFSKHVDPEGILKASNVLNLGITVNSWVLYQVQRIPDEYMSTYGPICGSFLMPPSQKYVISFCSGASEPSEIDRLYSLQEKILLYQKISGTFKEIN